MVLMRKLKSLSRLSKIYSRSCRFSAAIDEQSFEKPTYPPIEDLSNAAVKRRAKQKLHDKYKNLNTVEEKLFSLNHPRYWGWEPIILNEGELPYNALPFVKYITRTKFSEVVDLPLKSCDVDIDPKDFVNVIKSQIQEAILFETYERRHSCESEINANSDVIDDIKAGDLKVRSLLNQINRILMVNLSNYAPYLIDFEVDYDPRLEAFWRVGGFKPSEEEHRVRTEVLERDDVPWEWTSEDGDELEHWFQYFGNTVLQLRSSLPLVPISNTTSVSDEDIAKLTCDNVRCSPHFYGFEKKQRFGTTVPGFWPGKGTNEFGVLSYHLCNHLLGRPPHFGVDEHCDAVHAQAVLAGYAWLHGQASYQGFSTFNDITYPLVSQSIITDGQSFSFYIYQLNTMLMHKEYYDCNKMVNLCYGTPRIKLYETIKGRDFIGWNDDVILKLILMYLNKTSRRDYNMKPYLNENEMYISEITDIDERRIWLHDRFRHMYSNRPRHKLPYEIFDWEWIYKIKFMTRPMEPRRRPFETWQNPLIEKKCNDSHPKYIPKSMRYPDKPKQKFYNTYFPDAF